MLFTNLAALALATSAQLAAAAPAKTTARADPSLRLVKTSPEDEGKWVTEEEKFELFTSKKIGFVDITDIKDESVLAKLSEPDTESDAAIQAITYPSAVAHVTEGNALIAKSSNTNPQSWLKTLSNYQNRHYKSTYGTQAATWLFNTVKSVAAVNSVITVKQVTHSFSQPSIIATIPGENANIVIAGAHFDSTGGSSSARGPGADDNASGVVVVLETLRVLAEAGFKPKNTLEFHFYAGEEGGLLGSKDVFSQYKTQKKPVIAMMNQDMTGQSPNKNIAVYTDNVNLALTEFVKLVVTAYTGQKPNTSKCGYGCSDHASANSNGFPAALVDEDVFEETNPYIHSAQDTYDKIDWTSITRHTKFTIGFMVEGSYI